MSTTETETPPAPPVRKQTVLYDLNPVNGAITRHDTKLPMSKRVTIAALRDGKVLFAHKDFVRYENHIRGLLKSRGIVAEFVPYVERPPVMRDAVLMRDFSTDGDVVEPASAPPVPTGVPSGMIPLDLGPDGIRMLTVDQRKAVNHLRSREGYPLGEVERPAPPAPRKSTGAGDKTPDYSRWLLRYHPAEFCRVYGVERMGPIEITVPGEVNPATGMMGTATRRWESGHVLARRVTIFTDKLTNQPDDGEGGDS